MLVNVHSFDSVTLCKLDFVEFHILSSSLAEYVSTMCAPIPQLMYIVGVYVAATISMQALFVD